MPQPTKISFRQNSQKDQKDVFVRSKSAKNVAFEGRFASKSSQATTKKLNAIAEKINTAETPNPALFVEYAKVCLTSAKGDFFAPRTAKEALQSAISADGQNHEAHYLFSTMFPNYDEALSHINTAISLKPYSTKYLGARADLHSEFQKHDLALQDVERMIQLEPENSYHHSKKGDVCLKKGIIGWAEDAYKKALELDDKNPEALDGLGYIARVYCDNQSEGEYYGTKAIKAYEALTKEVEKESRRVYSEPVHSFDDMERLMDGEEEDLVDDAESILASKQGAITPEKAAKYHTNLAWSLCQMSLLARALSHASKAIELDPKAEQYTIRAVAYHRMGEGEIALEEVNTAIKEGCAPIGYAIKARILNSANKHEEAQKALAIGKQKYPNIDIEKMNNWLDRKFR